MWPRLRRIGTGQKWAQARDLFQRGDFAQAASMFDELANRAEGLGTLDRAGDLRLEAARCYLRLDDIERADQEGARALELFLRAQRRMKVRRLLPRMIAALEQHGRHEEARNLRQKAEQLLGPMAAMAGSQGALPAKCPSCGGPIKPNEVHWVGRRSVECPYCGSVVSAVERVV